MRKKTQPQGTGDPHAEVELFGHDLVWASKRLGLSASTVKNMVVRKELPHHRIGRRIVLYEKDIQAFLAARRVEASR